MIRVKNTRWTATFDANKETMKNSNHQKTDNAVTNKYKKKGRRFSFFVKSPYARTMFVSGEIKRTAKTGSLIKIWGRDVIEYSAPVEKRKK